MKVSSSSIILAGLLVLCSGIFALPEDPVTTSTVPPSTENTTVTTAPSTPPTTPSTEKPTSPPDTTTVAPTPTPTPPTTSTKAPTTPTTSTVPPSTSTAAPSTTPVPVHPSHSTFSLTSFVGGMVFAFGILAIGFVSWKFYKARNERNYHTL